jgi:hypothetical protein
MGDVTVELRRSGFADWHYDALGYDLLWAIVLLPIAFLANVLTHVVIFRCGWTVHVSAAGTYTKVRYRRKADALADMDRLRALAEKLPQPEPDQPVKLPTRGGSLRRPW